MKLVLRSLGITFAVSSIFAYFLTHYDIGFLKSFFLVTAIQIIGWNIFQYFVQSRFRAAAREQDNEMLRELAKQSLVAPCAYCNKDNLVPVRLDEDTKFECSKCKETSSLLITVESAQITTPLDVEKTLSIINNNE